VRRTQTDEMRATVALTSSKLDTEILEAKNFSNLTHRGNLSAGMPRPAGHSRRSPGRPHGQPHVRRGLPAALRRGVGMPGDRFGLCSQEISFVNLEHNRYLWFIVLKTNIIRFISLPTSLFQSWFEVQTKQTSSEVGGAHPVRRASLPEALQPLGRHFCAFELRAMVRCRGCERWRCHIPRL
jgi:hypothetical protein